MFVNKYLPYSKTKGCHKSQSFMHNEVNGAMWKTSCKLTCTYVVLHYDWLCFRLSGRFPKYGSNENNNDRLFVPEYSLPYKSSFLFTLLLLILCIDRMASSHSEICVRRLRFLRDLKLVSTVMSTDFSMLFPSYLPGLFGNFIAFWFTVRFRSKTMRPWE